MSEENRVELETVRAERCETCRFRESNLILDKNGLWATAFPKGEGELITEREHEDLNMKGCGTCHRYPPRTDGRFPDVYLDDWCGEWKAK